jgi:peptide/nickel transport system ATP-binding protein
MTDTTSTATVPTDGTDAPLLAVEDLHVTYATRSGAVPAVRGVDLTVRSGEVVGLAGESGCGKSTVAASVLRLLPASAEVSGRVLLDGEDVLGMTWGRVRQVRWARASMVFQGALHSLNPVQRVVRQVAEPIVLHRGLGAAEAEARAVDLLGQVGIPANRATAYPHQLSGGQRQRVMIAMALACDPQLLIADEPTTALDVMVQAQILDLLQELVRERGLGLLVISHDLSVLADRCDRVAVMYAGRVVESGRAEDVFSRPRHPYSSGLSDAFPTIGEAASRYRPAGLAGDPPDLAALPSGCAFHPRCGRAREDCLEGDVTLHRVGDREVACLHPLDATPGGTP